MRGRRRKRHHRRVDQLRTFQNLINPRGSPPLPTRSSRLAILSAINAPQLDPVEGSGCGAGEKRSN